MQNVKTVYIAVAKRITGDPSGTNTQSRRTVMLINRQNPCQDEMSQQMWQEMKLGPSVFNVCKIAADIICLVNKVLTEKCQNQ